MKTTIVCQECIGDGKHVSPESRFLCYYIQYLSNGHDVVKRRLYACVMCIVLQVVVAMAMVVGKVQHDSKKKETDRQQS